MSPMKIDLVWLGSRTPPPWKMGATLEAAPTPIEVDALMRRALPQTAAQAWLFWDSAAGEPDPATVRRALSRPGDVWHAGLLFGLGGAPRCLDSVMPTWIFNANPDSAVEATSWRLTLRAALVPTRVMRELGGICAEFRDLDAAALELGHRYVAAGVLMRHVPWLIENRIAREPVRLAAEDEALFLRRRYGNFWTGWGLARAVCTRTFSCGDALRAFRTSRRSEPAPEYAPFRKALAHASEAGPAPVSVIVPTVDRYPYLRQLLDRLRAQTVPPLEIVVVDQTPEDRRDRSLAAEFPNLPLRVIEQERPGQCTARNAALQTVRGEYVLLLDDDVEVEPDLIAAHLGTIRHYRCEVSSGIAWEPPARPALHSPVRASDVFPGGNTMFAREALRGVGLFDPAYDRGSRADGDLGLRIYRSGALMVLNPAIAVLHHRAPRGGLRMHKARVETYSGSRRSVWQLHLPSASEIYFARKHFTRRQTREMIWLRLCESATVRGSAVQKAAKLLVATALLPYSLFCLARSYRQAGRLLRQAGTIPSLVEHPAGVATRCG